MNTPTHTHMDHTEEKAPLSVKILAIVGFVASIALIIWLVIFGMRSLPGAFGSLANTFSTLRQVEIPTELSIATGKNIVNSKESFSVAWTEFGVPGNYTFSYKCTEGVAFDVRNATTVTALPCAQPLTFSNDVHTIDVIASSEKTRFTDVPFTVAFTSTDGATKLEKEAKITIVNATIPQGGIAQNTTPKPPAQPVVTPTPEPVEEEDPVTPAPTPKPAAQPITYFPVSNPNGYTDLRVSYLGIGRVVNGQFVPNGTFDEDSRGVLRFMVENAGTKTSDTFTYDVELPGNNTYESNTELPLKPNERAFFTVSFDVPNKDSHEKVEVSLDTDRDTSRDNNSFEWAVEITD